MKTIQNTVLLAMLLCVHSLVAQLKVIIKTGGDDLRGGQAAYAQLIYRNGTVSPEFDLNGGGNWGNNSENSKTFSVATAIRPEDIASVRIRHDGSPHRAFETYDNWNVDYLSVSLNGVQIAQCSGTPWYRFTGESRIIDCKSSYIQSPSGNCWVAFSGGTTPSYAFVGGNEANGTPLYVARVKYEGGIHIGKARTNAKGAFIPYGGKELVVEGYELFTCKGKWAKVSSGETPKGAVVGGNENDGTLLYIARAYIDGGWHVGKVRANATEAFIPYGGAEKIITDFQVLVR